MHRLPRWPIPGLHQPGACLHVSRYASVTESQSLQKYDTTAFDPPCKPGFRLPTARFWTSSTGVAGVPKVYSPSTCYLSLNFVDDPVYSFKKQFPLIVDNCPSPSPIQCLSSGTSGRRLLAAGTTTSVPRSSGTGTGPSDMRLKSNIMPTGRLVAGLLAEYTWQWNDAAKALHLDGYPTVGVMAQEAQAVFPQAVSTAADGYLRVNYGMLI